MSDKIKIIVAGIGGVGGYFGGRLAGKYHESPGIAVYFIARGEHLKQIKEKGLTIIDHDHEFVVHPALATSNPDEIGIADYIIICTKGYDLEDIVTKLRPCINENTLILPLLNGVDNVGKINKMLPGASVLHSCVYVVSRVKEPGAIHNTGNIEKIYFGSDHIDTKKMLVFEKIFTDAGIEAMLSENIITLTWEKYLFISPLATTTSYFNCCIGQIVEDPVKLDFIKKLIEEAKQVATAMKITYDSDIANKVVDRLRSLPYQNTSSMHSDYRNGKQHTELPSLTEYVIRCGKELGIATPLYELAHEALLKPELIYHS